ncbi:Archaeal fructose-16-bisphosphatase and related enzymes of inositol monophosphatase family [Rubrobacter radiotolerans]|uniref:Histidinol-phosphatase n=1 Tax=Rubrobacter radiotolerans TaxID=42256 RepID=A0A023X5H1_RUBRA|nr:inositol monophosphatase family protein [Rubrobacter radiotolerans]AHY47456.1 Archaeal fructose-16-bisphosphatase and related enzymes of inositol monophosphatase family [Rubrobacter radiotolerans]MDX5894859.1 inositol monophosphatase family protein [Rubrobacter radiotolerans]SMC06937.1 myo-inositol-1(or 4)-monophosphatase [Rubrobacter radiotolerans DSM 5868]
MQPEVSPEKLREFRDFAAETAYAAGRLTLGYFRGGVRAEFKGDDTPVTVADREAEALIRSRIERRYPDHALVGEEHGQTGPEEATCRWYVDPIDGTKAFVRGVPLYAVLVALEVSGEVCVGAAYFPALDEMLVAAAGLGCHLNGRPARVSGVRELRKSVVCFTETATFFQEGRKASFDAVSEAVYSFRGWSDAYGHALVATGRAEAAVEAAMNPWDCAPFLPILREAGGYFGDWSGEETVHRNEAVSANPHVKEELLALLGRTDGRPADAAARRGPG